MTIRGHNATLTIGAEPVPVAAPASVYAHPEYLALIRSMRDAPEDDTVRLVCADWLQERGESERAEFIRVQVELARLKADALAGSIPCDGVSITSDSSKRYRLLSCYFDKPTEDVKVGNLVRLSVDGDSPLYITVFDNVHILRLTPGLFGERTQAECELLGDPPLYPHVERLSELYRLERELLQGGPILETNWTRWNDFRAGYCLNLYDGTPHELNRAVLFRRGFVESVTCSAADWLTYAGAILAQHPVTRCKLTDRPNHSSTTDYERFNGALSAGGHERLVSRPRAMWLDKLAEFDSDRARTMLALIWPGITFELPA